MNIKSLKLKKEFKALLDYGTKRVDNLFIFFGVKGKTNDFRFGLIVSKKVFPLAVQRNKAKRRFREALRVVYKNNKNMKVDSVFILRKPGLTADFTGLVSRLDNALRKIRT